MAERLALLIKGLVSAAVIPTVLVGPPLALAHLVGNPLPDRISSPTRILDALERAGISDDVVINVLAVAAWLIWIQLAVALVAEVVAVARQRPSRRIPVLPGLQPVAANLVAAVLLLPAPWSSHTVAAEPGQPLQVVPVASVTVAPSPNGPVPTTPQPSVPAPQEAMTTYTVQRHDSFWSIAEAHLGDGLRWREVRDLNVGRPQADGGAVTANSDLVQPGWSLLIRSEPAPSQTSGLRTIHEVAAGEHLWGIAESALSEALSRPASDAEVDPYWREVVEANRAGLDDPTNPSLIRPGQQVQLPPTPVPPTGATAAPVPSDEESLPDVEPPPNLDDEPDEPAPVETSSEPAAPDSAPDVGDRGATASVGDDEGSSAGVGTQLPWALGVAGAGLASGIAAQVARRRRRQQSAAAPGLSVPRASEGLEDLDREVVIRADHGRTDDLRNATHEVARHLARRGGPRSRPRIAQVTDDRIELLLDVPCADAPPGWHPEASGSVWSRSRPIDSEEPLSVPMPLLVTIGRPDEHTEILFDLEAAQVTTIVGDQEASADLARSFLTEVRLHDSCPVQIMTAGGITDRVSGEFSTEVDLAAALEHARGWARIGRDAVQAGHFPHALAARGANRTTDGLVPLLVVLDRYPDGDATGVMADLLALMSDGAPLAILHLGREPSPVGTTIVVGDDRVMVPELNLDLEAQCLTAETAKDVDDLLEAAEEPATARSRLLSPSVFGEPQSSNGTYHDRPHEVLVRVLGDIAVDGGIRPLTAKQLGVLCYVALHPDHSADRIEEALWPHLGDTRRNRLHVTLSQVRSAIGTDNLPAMGNAGTYRVGPAVTTDLDLFRSRVTYAHQHADQVALPILQGALDLVTGPVFSYRRSDQASFSWVDLEHWISDTEALVVDVAWRAWEMCHEASDTEGAIHAARQGLLGSPANTTLTEALMRTYAESGDHSAAEAVFTSHARALDRLGLGDPDSSTLELREELMTTRR